MSHRTRLSLFGLCILVGGSGALHFIVPGPYRRIVPTPLRAHAAAVVAASGICELMCAALLAIPRTRRLGATATVALFVAVFPANIQMALDTLHADTPVAVAVGAWLRLPLQAPLILWALRFRRSSGGGGRSAATARNRASAGRERWPRPRAPRR
ncbi:MAG: hypothetical protein M3Y58_00190 [Chloroflexota bacterium]|nr:hypothetical protein [Chloroflexota bacterium]